MHRTLFSAALAFAVLFPGTAEAQSGGLELTNLGVWRANIFTGHVLTPAPTAGAKAAAAPRVLYAPADTDDPAFRAQIAAALGGGAVVDYFDARNATPDNVLLSTYDAVHTFVDYGYLDNIAIGDNLATYSDAGGTVILGVSCTSWSGKQWLDGAIMGPKYCPVSSPTGKNLYTGSPYLGNGTICLYNGVSKLDVNYRDDIALQGSGAADGHYVDGAIATAYRPLAGAGGGLIVYSNGCGAIQFGGTGDWANVIANATTCLPGVNPGSCTSRQGVMGVNPKGYDCVDAPSAGLLWNTSIDTIPVLGTSTLQTLVITSLSGPTENVPIFGFEMLALPPYVINSGFGSHAITVPVGTNGMGLATQGVRIETDGLGGIFIVLMNAQDVMIG